MSTGTCEQGICARIQQRVARVVGSRRYAMWFDGSSQFDYDLDEQELRVAVPNQFVADWIGKHFEQDLQDAASDELGSTVALSLCVDPVPFTAAGDADQSLPTNSRQAGFKPTSLPARQGGPQRQADPQRQRPAAARLRYRLGEFIVGSSNELAYGAASRMATDDHPVAGDPLFIHGGCGLGKTHLLQGICRQITRKDPAARVHYTTGEQFTNDYITAIRANKLEAFRARMRRLELLAIDDVHFIANKQATQQEFLHSFDHIEMGGARVVLASDSHPKLIKQFSEALVSRCLRGMVVQINSPDAKTRLRLLHVLAKRRGMVLQPSVAQTLASHCDGSVRDIEGMLTKLHALASLGCGGHGKVGSDIAPIGHRLVDHLLQTDAATSLRKPVRFETILDTVTGQLGVGAGQILGRSRHRLVVLARSLVIYLARKLTAMSYPEIAAAMGRRNHSTVITSAQRMGRLLEQNEPILLAGEMTPTTPTELVDRLRHAIGRA